MDCALTGDHHGDNMNPCKFIDEKNCYYKQLQRSESRVKELEEKLKIAEEALQYYAELYIDTDICDDQFFGYGAQQALKQMEEVK